MNAPAHRLTKPHGEKLPWRERLPATLQDRDFEMFIDGHVTAEMEQALDKVRRTMEWRARRDANRRQKVT